MTAQETIRIRDIRQKEKFVMDDAYMNGYACLCGWQATITYNSLCRHANKDQYCFPSVELMAEENGVDRKTIMKGLQSLKDWNIIGIERKRTEAGVWKNNAYILLDKSEWKSKANQVPVKDMEPSPCEGLVQVPVKDTKVTHIKDIKKEIYKERKFGSLENIGELDLREKRFLKDTLQLPERATELPYQPIPKEKWEAIKKQTYEKIGVIKSKGEK